MIPNPIIGKAVYSPDGKRILTPNGADVALVLSSNLDGNGLGTLRVLLVFFEQNKTKHATLEVLSPYTYKSYSLAETYLLQSLFQSVLKTKRQRSTVEKMIKDYFDKEGLNE